VAAEATYHTDLRIAGDQGLGILLGVVPGGHVGEAVSSALAHQTSQLTLASSQTSGLLALHKLIIFHT
jgi:hypothetical protein